MKKKILTCLVLVMAVLFFILCDNCFAVTTCPNDITKENLEYELGSTPYFTTPYTVQDTVSENEETQYLDLNNPDYEMEMVLDKDNSRFLLVGDDVTFIVNYALNTTATHGYDKNFEDDSTVIYTISANINLNELNNNYKAILEQIKMRCYLCSSFVIGQDFSLAYTAYKQKNDGFEEIMWSNNNNGESLTVGINLTELRAVGNTINEEESNYVPINYQGMNNDHTKMSIHNLSCRLYLGDEYKSPNNGEDVYYTGDAIEPEIVVSYYDGDELIYLDDAGDYEVEFTNNTNLGTATVEIFGRGKYVGTSKITFNIIKRNISDNHFAIYLDKDQYYTGNEIQPDVDILDKSENKYLEENKDYTISYSNNIKPGKAKITIEGKGLYTGTKEISFNIKIPAVVGVINKKEAKTSITVKWNKLDDAAGYVLEKYDTSKYKVVKELTGNSYKVTDLKAGTTYKFRVRAYRIIDGEKYYGDYSSVAKLSTITKTPTLSKVTAGSKKATVNWKKVNEATGYEVYMSTKKSSGYKRIKLVTSNKTLKYTKTKLTKKKTYYFKVRTYRTVNGKKVYSSYSSVKSVKVK